MLEFPALCRLCSQKNELIYNLYDEQAHLMGKLATVAAETVEFNDALPQKICQSCHDKLEETYKFQQQIYHIFKIYKTFMEFQQSLESNDLDAVKTEPFDYVDEEYVSEELRQFIHNMNDIIIPASPDLSVSVPLSRVTPIRASTVRASTVRASAMRASTVRAERKRLARKPEIAVVKRKRGRPRKYSGLMNFKNDDLTDVQKMKNVVVNSVPKIDPDYEPDQYFDRPLVINLRKRRGRPRTPRGLIIEGEGEKKKKVAEKEDEQEMEVEMVVEKNKKEGEVVVDVEEEPGCSGSKDHPPPPKGTPEAAYWRTAV